MRVLSQLSELHVNLQVSYFFEQIIHLTFNWTQMLCSQDFVCCISAVDCKCYFLRQLIQVVIKPKLIIAFDMCVKVKESFLFVESRINHRFRLIKNSKVNIVLSGTLNEISSSDTGGHNRNSLSKTHTFSHLNFKSDQIFWDEV